MNEDNFQSPPSRARWILREALFGSLATEGEGGYPFVSLVGTVALPDGAPALLLSSLARHTHNVRKDPRVSLLMLENPRADNPLAAASLTVTGRVAEIDKGAVRARYVARHPEAAKYADFADFSFWRIEIESAHLVAALGKTSNLRREDLIGFASPPPLSPQNDSKLMP